MSVDSEILDQLLCDAAQKGDLEEVIRLRGIGGQIDRVNEVLVNFKLYVHIIMIVIAINIRNKFVFKDSEVSVVVAANNS